jgi:hypothetical protein
VIGWRNAMVPSLPANCCSEACQRSLFEMRSLVRSDVNPLVTTWRIPLRGGHRSGRWTACRAIRGLLTDSDLRRDTMHWWLT